jgi:hypothetical protein
MLDFSVPQVDPCRSHARHNGQFPTLYYYVVQMTMTNADVRVKGPRH